MLATILGFLAARLCRGSLRWARLLAALPLVLWAAFSTPESSLVVMHQVRPPGWKDGVCLQSTGFTCAPAAAATVLSVHGVQTDESEMAARCETRECGTFMADVAKGLGAMLPPHEFSIYYARITPAELRQIHLPCVTCNTSGPRYTHAWVVFRINSDGTMEVGEGGQGRQTVSWQGFTGTFTGETVVIVPKSAPSPEAARVYSELEASGRAIASFGVPSG
ncbi:MAG: cysteine peptidase family C39 domain-containing protein [Planctomycetota bacterium]|nr:cysteine peptidase family C39 domain-containing protein [Planctomycetota bacterium]